MEEKELPPEKQEQVNSQFVATPLLVWIGQNILAGIVYSLAAFLTTIGLKKWWYKDKTKN